VLFPLDFPKYPIKTESKDLAEIIKSNKPDFRGSGCKKVSSIIVLHGSCPFGRRPQLAALSSAGD